MTPPSARLRLDLAYDGAAFHGWAEQPGLRTVQGVLQEWIGRILRLSEPPALTVAGRTDTGVHARAQVAHLDAQTTDAAELAGELGHRLRRVLPDDIVVHRVSPAPAAFDARFAAVWRRYCYRLADRATDPLVRGWVLRVPRDLDVDAMDAAARALTGLHDFGAFCKRREGATTVRTLQEASVTRASGGHVDGVVEVWLQADAFCHSMVRSLVGGLVDVGLGRRSPGWLTAHLDVADRAGDVTVLPPHGLVLEAVGYPDDAHLAARVTQARARRDESAPCQEDA